MATYYLYMATVIMVLQQLAFLDQPPPLHSSFCHGALNYLVEELLPEEELEDVSTAREEHWKT